MQNFKVSIIIPVYNREKYLVRAVKSCIHLPQKGEIIIIDDGSNDNSLSIAKNLATEYPEVKVLQHPDKKNHGRSASRNLGIKNAKYDYIAFLDSDDWYLPNRFKYEEIIFKKRSDVDGVYGVTSSSFENQEAKVSFLKKYPNHISKVNDDVTSEELYKTFIYSGKGQWTTDAIVVKKSTFLKAGLFPLEISFCEDVHLWCRLAAKCKLVSNHNPNPVAIRYVHFENTILNTDDIFDSSFRYLYKSLFIWALKQKDFSYDKKNDYFIGHKKMYPEESDFKTLIKFVIRHPVFLFNKFTWHKLIQIIKHN